MKYRNYRINNEWTPTMERWEVMETLSLITNQRMSYIHSLLQSDSRVEFWEGGFNQVFIPTPIIIKAIDTLAMKVKPAKMAQLEEFKGICELTLQPLTKASAKKIKEFQL